MLYKIKKSLQIALLGAIIFAIFPLLAHAARPEVTTNPATNIENESATFAGSVDTGNLPTDVWFEYSTNSRLSNNRFYSSTIRMLAGDDGRWSDGVSELKPNTTYHFRAVAENRQGTVYGKIRSFKTRGSSSSISVSQNSSNNTSSGSFAARTERASSISGSSVQLNSLILNPGNDFSKAWFEWGPTVNLGSKTEAVSTGTLSSVKHVHTLAGLAPGTTYYYRAAAENSSVRNLGVILSFTTKSGGVSTRTYTTITNTDEEDTETGASIKEKGGKTTSESSALAASVIGAGSFMPSSLLGWLVLFILVLVLVILAKHLHRNLIGKQPEHTREHA